MIRVAPYDPAGVALAPTLSRVLRHPHDFRPVAELLATGGVRVIHVEAIPGSKIDAAAFMHAGSPSVVPSGRGQRLDKVLFALRHELADRVAGNRALPAGIPPVRNRVSAEWVKSVANELGVTSRREGTGGGNQDWHPFCPGQELGEDSYRLRVEPVDVIEEEGARSSLGEFVDKVTQPLRCREMGERLVGSALRGNSELPDRLPRFRCSQSPCRTSDLEADGTSLDVIEE